MKKIIAIVAVLAAFTVPSKAQDGWSIGAGFRGDLTKVCCQDGLYGGYLQVEYADNEILGPVGLGVGLSIERLIKDQYEAVSGTTLRNGSLSLQLPMFARYGWDLGSSYLYVQAGPTLFLGLTLTRSPKGSSTLSKMDLYRDGDILTGDVYNRFDVLLGGAVGIVINDKFKIQCGADYGFISRVIGTHGINNVQLTAGVAYVFGS